MPTCDLNTTNDIAAIERAPRALVYLAVEWSVPERRSREVVRRAIESLPADLDFRVFAIEEDGVLTRPWLVSHGWPECTYGYGSLLWLERGRCVAKELLPAYAEVEGIVRKTMELWSRPEV